MTPRDDTHIMQEWWLLIQLKPLAVAKAEGFSPRAWWVFESLYSWGKTSGQYFPTQQLIADRAMCSVPTVKKAMPILYRLGFVTAEEPGGGRGNVYSVHFDVVSAFIKRNGGTTDAAVGTGIKMTPVVVSKRAPTGIKTSPQLTTNPKPKSTEDLKTGEADSHSGLCSDSDSSGALATEMHARQTFAIAIYFLWAKGGEQLSADRRVTHNMFAKLWDESLGIEACRVRVRAAILIAEEAKTSDARRKMAWWVSRVKKEILCAK